MPCTAQPLTWLYKIILTENDADEIVTLLETYSISFGRSENGEQLVFVGDVDVHSSDSMVTNNASWVSAIRKCVKNWFICSSWLLARWSSWMDRILRQSSCPMRNWRFSSCFSWGKRQNTAKENLEKGIPADLETLKRNSGQDYRDSHHEVSPMSSDGSIHFDTTGIGIAEVIKIYWRKKQKKIIDK